MSRQPDVRGDVRGLVPGIPETTPNTNPGGMGENSNAQMNAGVDSGRGPNTDPLIEPVSLSETGWVLGPGAARAMDRVFGGRLVGESGTTLSEAESPSGLPAGDAETDSSETMALRALLATLEPAEGLAISADRGVLADLIVLRARRLDDAIARADGRLSPADADALDAWLLHSGDADRTPRALRERAHRHAALAGVLADGEVGATEVAREGFASARSALIERTLARVEAAEREERPLAFERAAETAGRGSFRLADLGAIAAVLIVGGAMLRPAFDSLSASREGLACFGALGSVAQALGAYQNDYDGLLPVASGSFGGSWWDVGTTPERSNAANLFILKTANYSTLDDLACAGNAHAAHRESEVVEHDWRSIEQVSFSYRLPGLGDSGRLRFDAGQDPARAVVMADRSPVVLRAVARQTIRPFDNSPNHDGRGQRLLFADGSVTMATSPVLETGDNIWLPNQLERAIHQAAASVGLDLEGRELPASADDVFLGP